MVVNRFTPNRYRKWEEPAANSLTVMCESCYSYIQLNDDGKWSSYYYGTVCPGIHIDGVHHPEGVHK